MKTLVVVFVLSVAMTQPALVMGETIVVNSDGTGDYTLLKDGINAAKNSQDDVVTLYVRGGPYHLGDELTTTNGIWWGQNDNQLLRYPYLRIIADQDRVLITGLRTTGTPIDWDPVPGTTQVYATSWPVGNDYAFDWDPDFAGLLADDDGVGLDGTDQWVWQTLQTRPDSLGVETDQIHDGRYLIRREFLVIHDPVGDEFLSMEPHHINLVENEETPINTYGVNIWEENAAQRVIRARSQFVLSDISESRVYAYIPVQRHLFRFNKCRGIDLENLEFAFTASFHDEAAVQLSWVMEANITDCYFHDVAGMGLSIGHSAGHPQSLVDPIDEIPEEDVVEWHLYENPAIDRIDLSDLLIENCGFTGLSVAHSKGVTLRNSIIRENNVLGYRSGTMGWRLAGAKVFRVRKMQQTNVQYLNNYANGLWFDQNCGDIQLDNLTIEGNYFRGLFLEKSPGPVTMTGGTIASNSRNTSPVVDGALHPLPAAEGQTYYETKRGNLVLNAFNEATFNGVQFREPSPHFDDIGPVAITAISHVILDVLEYQETQEPPVPTVEVGFSAITFEDCVFERVTGHPWFRFGPFVNDGDQPCGFWDVMEVYGVQGWTTGTTTETALPLDIVTAQQNCVPDPED